VSNNGSKWCRPERRLAIYARDRHACVYCNASGGLLTLDHVTPVELGGTHHESNLVTACFGCNSAKQAKNLRSWLAYLRARGTCTEGLARRIRQACARRIDRDEGKRLVALRRAA
jgi:hypothetical protein